MSIEEFKNISEKATVIDTRVNAEGGIVKGTYWLHMNGPLCNWVSMLIKPEDPLLVITDEDKHIEIIERMLRIGFFNVKGYNNFKMADYPSERFLPKIVDGK